MNRRNIKGIRLDPITKSVPPKTNFTYGCCYYSQMSNAPHLTTFDNLCIIEKYSHCLNTKLYYYSLSVISLVAFELQCDIVCFISRSILLKS